MTVFNGSVRVKDGNKAPQDYGENRVVEINVAFETDTDAKLEQAINHAGTVASNKVAELLGHTSKAVTVEKSAETKPATTRVPRASTKAKDEKPAAADPAAMPGAEPQQNIQTGGERINPESPKDVADVTSLDDVLSSTPPVITDNDLMATITQHNAKTKNSAAIRALIGKYVPQDGKPHQAAEIPQEKRAAFKDELAKIGPAS